MFLLFVGFLAGVLIWLTGWFLGLPPNEQQGCCLFGSVIIGVIFLCLVVTLLMLS